MINEYTYNDEIADYDEANTENQAIFPGDDLGDLPWPNPRSIDVERQLDIEVEYNNYEI